MPGGRAVKDRRSQEWRRQYENDHKAICEFNQYCIARPCRPYRQVRHTNSKYGGRGQRGAAPLSQEAARPCRGAAPQATRRHAV
eukprot:3371752-Pleurochrysis_carterae.AAC.1